mgnify:FL=1
MTKVRVLIDMLLGMKDAKIGHDYAQSLRAIEEDIAVV